MIKIKKEIIILELVSILALLFILILTIVSMNTGRKQLGYLTVIPGNSTMYIDEFDLEIKGFDKNGTTFFFLPSFINLYKLSQETSEYKILTIEGYEIERPLVNEIQDVLVFSPDGSTIPWKIGFFKSENLYTFSFHLDNLEFYEVNHDVYSDMDIDVFSPAGKTVYHEDNALVKGRGNASWPSDSSIDEKRPFQIRLPEKTSFCGMKRSDKWALVLDDETCMHTKLAYDLAADMGMEYYIESDWVDLYINNEYMGNYLLCHEPGIGSDDLDIGNITGVNEIFKTDNDIKETVDMKGYDYSLGDNKIPQGGYLIEKNIDIRYMRKECGFKCNDDYFTIKSPGNASWEEVAYIHDRVLDADSRIHGDVSGRTGMVDVYSFARQYLISQISLNPDAAITSYFFYKKPEDENIYAGPCWDFDGAFGEWSEYRNYTFSIEDVKDNRMKDSGHIPLDWDEYLLQNDSYNEYVRMVYGKYVPVYEKLMNEGLERYRDKIYGSVCMNYIRWTGADDYEEKVRNYYRYLKFFLYNRFKYLSDYYEISIELDEPDYYDNVDHVLTFKYEDGRETVMIVPDGAQLNDNELPIFDHLLYQGWHIFEENKMHGYLTYYDPIFADMTFVLDDYEGESND